MAAPGLVSVTPAEGLPPVTLDQETEQPSMRQASSTEADRPGCPQWLHWGQGPCFLGGHLPPSAKGKPGPATP